MSTPAKPDLEPIEYAKIESEQQNGFGLAGFIVSIVGLFFCGLPSIFGAVISLIGLSKQPRGFAIAGLAVGVVGMMELMIVGFMIFSAYQVGRSAATYLHQLPVELQLNVEAGTIGNEWERLSRIPTQEEGEALLTGKRDLMGNQLVYETDGGSFSIRTAGADGSLDTADDIVAGPFHDIESTRQFEFDQDGFDEESLKKLLKQDYNLDLEKTEKDLQEFER